MNALNHQLDSEAVEGWDLVVDTFEGGVDGVPGSYRQITRTVPLEVTDGAYVSSVKLISPFGVLVAIPINIDNGGPTWPPLPFDDWSAVSAEYRAKVMARLAELDDDD